MREAIQPLDTLVHQVTTKASGRKDLSLPYVGLENIEAGSFQLLGTVESAASISTNGFFESGDVLFGKLRPNLRKCVHVKFRGYCSTDLIVLRAVSGVEPRFAARMLQSDAVFRRAELTAMGTKMPRTSWEEIGSTEVWRPPLPEQRSIAGVLDTVDDAIRKTEQIVAKLQQVKQGMLHDLLTRGIDDNDNLRDPERYPGQFQESPLGRIPKGWEAIEARAACTLITKGTTPPTSAFLTGERRVRFLRVDNLTFTGALDTSFSELFVDETTHRTVLRRSAIRAGDVLMNIVGPPLGKVSIVPVAEHEWNINQAICVFRVGPKLAPRLLAEWLLSEFVSAWFRREAKQTSGQVNLTLEMCGDLLIPIPPQDEQDRILNVLEVTDGRLGAESRLLTKLRLFKAGLAEDLLTGRVRTTSLGEVTP